jgi:predicted MFS family arabinose efflux permease
MTAHRPPVAAIMAVSLATLSGLFGPQAFAPLLATDFTGGAAATGAAINTIMLGMALGGVLATILTPRLSRVTVLSLLLLATSVVTAGLAGTQGLRMLAWLRFLQGVLMAASFATTMAYVAESWGERGHVARLMAAYVTGNVLSNILGRMMSGWIADHAGWPIAFLALAALQAAGALAAWRLLPRDKLPARPRASDVWRSVQSNLVNTELLSCLGVGFLIMFLFSGVFTFANFRLAAAPFWQGPTDLGKTYLVFLPAVLTTPLAARTALCFGYARAMTLAAAGALAGLLLTLGDTLASMLIGMMLVGVAAFYAQALATSFCGLVARSGRASSAGLYLAAYYTGGLAATLILGPVYERYGWSGLIAVEAMVPATIALTALHIWSRRPVPA